MEQETIDKKVCEVVGIFNNMHALQTAVDELHTRGFDLSEVSMLADEETVKEHLGEEYKKIKDIACDPSAPRSSYVANENIGAAQGGLIGGLLYVGTLAAATLIIAAGGTLAVTLTTAALTGGASSILGMLLGKYVGKKHAEYLENQLKHGGLLLWVHIREEQREKVAQEILKKHNAHDVHTHYVPAEIFTKA
jgi:hypothetical protein